MPSKTKNPIIKLQRQFILAALILLLIALIVFANEFLSTLLVSAVIVTGIYPLHKIIRKKVKVINSLPAFISLILVSIGLLIPVTLLFFIIAEEATSAYLALSEKFAGYNGDFSLPALFQIEWIQNLMQRINQYVPVTPSDIAKAAADFIGNISSFLLGQTTNVLKNLTVFLIHIVVFMLSLFYFLRDGDKLVEYIKTLLPLPEAHRQQLMKKLYQLSYGMIYGIFGAAIAQGALVGIGFAIVGINNAAFWGAIAALFSPLPYIGTAIIWVPAVIALFISQQWLWGIFLLLWGMLLVSSADNFVKPYLIGSSTALHPLAVLVVLLGGAFTYGIKGLIFGPFILTLTLAFIHIYELEFRSDINSNVKKVAIRKAIKK